MTYKIGANTIIDLDRVGVFNTVYFNNDTYDMADTTGFKEGSNTWFSSTGNVSVTKLSTNTFARYTQATGFNYGYTSGGSPAPSTYSNVTDRFPFAAATVNSTDVGDLTVARYRVAGQSSSTHGYTSGGFGTGSPAYFNVTDRFPFADATVNSTDVGNLTQERERTSGQSSTTYGYTSGGLYGGLTFTNIIDRFPFADATVDSTDVGDMTGLRYSMSSSSSMTHGYINGSYLAPATNTARVERFPFAVATVNATTVGNLISARNNGDGGGAGQSSAEHGYASGGVASPATYSNIIDRFPFALDTVNAALVGALTVVRDTPAGQSYITHGYSSGGAPSSPTRSNVTDRFPFAAQFTDATDVGDLTVARTAVTGQQY